MNIEQIQAAKERGDQIVMSDYWRAVDLHNAVYHLVRAEGGTVSNASMAAFASVIAYERKEA